METIEIKKDTKEMLEKILKDGFFLLDGETADDIDGVIKVLIRIAYIDGYVQLNTKQAEKLYNMRYKWENKNLY